MQIKMKNYSIIEDFDLETYENFVNKDNAEMISECLLRNFGLIREYANEQSQQFLTKFRKKIIPKLTQQLNDFCQQQQTKYRRLIYNKRRIPFDNCISNRKIREGSPELSNQTLLKHQNEILADLNSIQQKNKQKSEPILLNVKAMNERPQKWQQINIQESTKSALPSERKICGPLFLITSKKGPLSSENFVQKGEKHGKIHSSIYNDSINFCKKFLFKTTFDQICKTRDSKQFQETQTDLFSIRRTFADEKSIEKKMINVLKQRKSSRTLKMKIFSNYINSKRMLMVDIGDQSKENTLKKKSKNCGSLVKKELSPKDDKKKLGQLGLRGKPCLPLKHRLSASCIFSPLSFNRDNIENFQPIMNLPPSTQIGKLLINNMSNSRFLLPKFS